MHERVNLNKNIIFYFLHNVLLIFLRHILMAVLTDLVYSNIGLSFHPFDPYGNDRDIHLCIRKLNIKLNGDQMISNKI